MFHIRSRGEGRTQWIGFPVCVAAEGALFQLDVLLVNNGVSAGPEFAGGFLWLLAPINGGRRWTHWHLPRSLTMVGRLKSASTVELMIRCKCDLRSAKILWFRVTFMPVGRDTAMLMDS